MTLMVIRGVEIIGVGFVGGPGDESYRWAQTFTVAAMQAAGECSGL